MEHVRPSRPRYFANSDLSAARVFVSHVPRATPRPYGGTGVPTLNLNVIQIKIPARTGNGKVMDSLA